MKTNFALALFAFACAACAHAQAQEEALRATELVVVVNAAAKLDTLSEAELHHVLFGKDARFDLVGLPEQHYRALLKQMLKTNSGNFEREWLGLISRGKKKKRPLVTAHALELVALAMKNKNAIAVLEWRELKKAPSAFGLKVVSRCRLKP